MSCNVLHKPPDINNKNRQDSSNAIAPTISGCEIIGSPVALEKNSESLYPALPMYEPRHLVLKNGAKRKKNRRNSSIDF